MEANPASDLLVLDGGALIPLRFVVGTEPGVRVIVEVPDGLLDLLLIRASPCARLRIDVFTLFPEVIDHYADASILGRARARGQLDLRTHDVRDAATDPHRSVDDAPFGGGAGMVLGPEPVFGAVEAVAGSPDGLPRPLVLLSPSGRRFDQQVAEESRPQAEDSRCSAGATRAWTSGWPIIWSTRSSRWGTSSWPAASWPPWWWWRRSCACCPECSGTTIRPATRASPPGCSSIPSTPARPSSGAGRCPDTLLSGDHARVDRWRRAQALVRTLQRRPDLIADRGGLTEEEVRLLVDHGEVRLLREHGYDW